MFVKPFGLICLSLISILGLCSSTSVETTTSGEQQPLESVHLTPAQVKSLCDSVSSSQIDNDQLYQWINVQKEAEQQQQQTEEKSKNTCYKIGFTPCVGEARFPLTKDCGFFNMVPANGEECSSSSSSRSKRSTSTKPVSMSHGEAQHLCHTFGKSQLPSTPTEVNYVAVKINMLNPEDEKAQLPHPSEECVAWAFKPCMHEDQKNCDEWHKTVKSVEKCAEYHSNDPDDHPKHPHRPKMDQSISSSSLREMNHVLRCKSTEGDKTSKSSIQCQVQPTEWSLDMFGLPSHLAHSRPKRQWGRRRHYRRGGGRCVRPACCCGSYGCGCCCSGDDCCQR